MTAAAVRVHPRPMTSACRLAPAVLLSFALSLAGCGDDPPPLDPDGSTIDGDGGVITGDAGVLPTGDAGPPPPPSGYVDPMCTDGQYTETPPDPTASLDGVSFAGDVPAFVDAALARRYPFGLELVRGGRMETRFGDCSELFAGSPSSDADLYRRLDTIVHECGHIYDGFLSRSPTNAYVISAAPLRFDCRRGDTTTRGGDTFARSRIRTDAYQAMRAPCTGGGARGCDFYADTYLDGDPDDATFQGGDQGFNMLLEEAVQYVNSLVTSWVFADRMSAGTSTSARDGILTLLWYVERYLHLARTTYPAAYAAISGDACWRDAILTVWGRAWLYLERTRGTPGLGIDDAAIEALVADPVLLDEIDRIRTASSCP